jgi:Na+-translocating ferredoxin:NAD+ oxidoreductase RnfD subunit
MNARMILGWTVVALLQQARVWFFGIRIEMPVALVVISSALLGAGVTSLFPRARKRLAK